MTREDRTFFGPRHTAMRARERATHAPSFWTARPKPRTANAVQDRRRHPRHPVYCSCWIETPDLTVFGPTQNLGAGGLFVRTAAPLEDGTPVELSLRIAGEPEIVHARAVVARSVTRGRGLPGPGLGLRFVRIARGKTLLRSVLDRALPLVG